MSLPFAILFVVCFTYTFVSLILRWTDGYLDERLEERRYQAHPKKK